MLAESKNTDGQEGHGLPFGYLLEHGADLLVLRRPDRSFVAAFSGRGADPFEIQAAVWEDAD